MATTTWKGTFYYKGTGVRVEKAKQTGSYIPVSDNLTGVSLSGSAPVAYFAVKGGAQRLIDLTAGGNEPVLSELNEAVQFGSMIFYLQPGMIEAANLHTLGAGFLPISFAFLISGTVNGKITQSYSLKSASATFVRKPQKPSDDPNVLYVPLKFSAGDLTEGFLGMFLNGVKMPGSK